MLKEELVTGLDQHLRANETKFASDPTFNEFYARTSSPVKREKSTTATGADGEKPPRKRKQSMKVKEELDSLYVRHVYLMCSRAPF